METVLSVHAVVHTNTGFILEIQAELTSYDATVVLRYSTIQHKYKVFNPNP